MSGGQRHGFRGSVRTVCSTNTRQADATYFSCVARKSTLILAARQLIMMPSALHIQAANRHIHEIWPTRATHEISAGHSRIFAACVMRQTISNTQPGFGHWRTIRLRRADQLFTDPPIRRALGRLKRTRMFFLLPRFAPQSF